MSKTPLASPEDIDTFDELERQDLQQKVEDFAAIGQLVYTNTSKMRALQRLQIRIAKALTETQFPAEIQELKDRLKRTIDAVDRRSTRSDELLRRRGEHRN
jgi:hypothetical protein